MLRTVGMPGVRRFVRAPSLLPAAGRSAQWQKEDVAGRQH